jgi:dTDP-4-dehydrorhamnose reductase
MQLCEKGAQGIVHATNSGDCTWYGFAKEIIRMSNLPAVVKPVTTAQFRRPARRPAYSVLSAASVGTYGLQMPDWQDALQRYLAEAQVS